MTVVLLEQVSGLAQNTASPYVELSAAATTGTAFEFDFNLSGTTNALVKLPSVLLAAGHKYTVYVEAHSASLQGIVTQDN